MSASARRAGDRAAPAVARDEPVWQAWMNEHFPAADDPNKVA